MSTENQQTQAQESGGSQVALTVRRAAGLDEKRWTDERIAAIARTVTPQGTSTAELGMFLTVAEKYDLDPFLNEIWLAKDKGRLILLTGRDSFLKVARRDPGYGGYRSGVVYEQDDFRVTMKADGSVDVHHEFEGLDRGPLVGAFCVVYKDGHPPVLVTRKWDDFKHLHGKDNWRNYGPDMIETRVITAGHRRAYNISGLYAPEEFVDGELDPAIDDSQRASVATRSKMSGLRERMDAARGTVQAEEEDSTAVQDADFEVVQDTPAEAPPTPEQDFDEQVSEHARLRKRYHATWREKAPDGVERADWQEDVIGKRSSSRWSSYEFQCAIEALEKGEGFEATEPAEEAPGPEAAVEPEVEQAELGAEADDEPEQDEAAETAPAAADGLPL